MGVPVANEGSRDNRTRSGLAGSGVHKWLKTNSSWKRLAPFVVARGETPSESCHGSPPVVSAAVRASCESESRTNAVRTVREAEQSRPSRALRVWERVSFPCRKVRQWYAPYVVARGTMPRSLPWLVSVVVDEDL